MTQLYLIMSPNFVGLVLTIALAMMLSLPRAWPQMASSGTADVISPSALRLDERTWVLFGIRGLSADAQCTRGGASFDCGDRVMALLRDKIRTQRVSCEPRSPVEAREVKGVCSIGAEDIASWLVRSGWAWADPGESVNYLVDESYARLQRRGIWEPDVKLVP